MKDPWANPAWIAGFLARADGCYTWKDNPYSEGSKMWGDWCDGWNCAVREQQKNRLP